MVVVDDAPWRDLCTSITRKGKFEMTLRNQRIGFGIFMLSSIGLFWPVPGFVQHGPDAAQHQIGADRQMRPERRPPAYDTQTETTITGAIQDLKDGGGRAGGPGPMAIPDRTLGIHDRFFMLKIGKETVEVRLAPTAFLAEMNVDIRNGDTVEVIGSRVRVGKSEVLLAREIRKGETLWTLRDVNGTPLWATVGNPKQR